MDIRKIGTSIFVALMILVAMYSTRASASTILYSIDFTSMPKGSQPLNWYHDPTFSVQNGTYASTGTTGYQVAYYKGSAFTDFTYSDTAIGLPHCGQLPPVLALPFRMQDRLNGYWFWGDIDKIQIVKWVNGYPNVLIGKGIGQINPTGTFTMTITANGNTLTANWDDKYTISVQDSTYTSGFVGVGTYHCNAAFNNLVVTGTGTSTSTTPPSSSTSITSTSSATSTTSSTPTTSTRTSTTSTTAVTSTITRTCVVVFVEVDGRIISQTIGACS